MRWLLPLLLVILAACSPKHALRLRKRHQRRSFNDHHHPARAASRSCAHTSRTRCIACCSVMKSRKKSRSAVPGDSEPHADAIKRIYDAEQARTATQRLIDVPRGRATKADEQAARAAIHDLRLARENQAVERRP